MKGYLRKTFEYTAGNTFNKILLLLLLPLFTRMMTPQEYAIYTNITIFMSFVGLIYMLGLQQALFSHFYQFKTKDHQFTIISTIIITVFTAGIVFSGIVFNFRYELSQLTTTNQDYQSIFIYVSLILLGDTLYSIILRILNAMEKSLNFAVLSIFRNLFLLILILLATITGKFSIQTVFLCILFSTIISVTIAGFNIAKIMIYLKREIKDKLIFFSVPMLLDLLKFGLPMIPGTIALLILRVSDRYMLTYLSSNGLHDVGIYAVGYRIGMIITFLTTIVSLVYLPYAVKIADDPMAGNSYRKMFKAFAVFGAILGSLIILFTWELAIFLLDTSYYKAVQIVVFSVISNYLLGLFYIINVAFYIRKKAAQIAFVVGLGALINIALNYILIPRLGVYGAGLTSMLSYLFIFMLNYRFAEEQYPLNYDYKYVTIGLLVMIILAIPNYFFRFIPVVTIIKLLVLLSVMGYTYSKYLHKQVMNGSIVQFITEKFKI
jgi:O-antigen/teichoic acid export membrane protein